MAASHLAGPTGWVEGQSLLALALPPPQSVPPPTGPLSDLLARLAGHLPIHSSAWPCQAFCRQFSLLSPSLSPFPAPAAFSEWCNCRTLPWPSVLQGRLLGKTWACRGICLAFPGDREHVGGFLWATGLNLLHSCFILWD